MPERLDEQTVVRVAWNDCRAALAAALHRIEAVESQAAQRRVGMTAVTVVGEDGTNFRLKVVGGIGWESLNSRQTKGCQQKRQNVHRWSSWYLVNSSPQGEDACLTWAGFGFVPKKLSKDNAEVERRSYVVGILELGLNRALSAH